MVRRLGILALLLPVGLGCGDDRQPAAGADAAIVPPPDAGVPPEDGLAAADAAPFAVSPQRVYDEVVWLTAPERAGRLAGKAGNEAALARVEALFASLGLTPVGDNGTFRQAFSFESWEMTAAPALAIDGTARTYGTDFKLVEYSGSASASGALVFVGHGMTVPPFSPAQHPGCPLDAAGYDDFAGVDVTGQIALVLRHGPADNQTVQSSCPANQACLGPPCLWGFGYKAANAKLHGAAAMLVVQDYEHAGEVVAGGTIDADYYDADFPTFFVDRAVLEAVIPDLPAWAATITTTLAPASHATGVTAAVSAAAGVVETDTANVLGALPGTDPVLGSEVVIIGAHIDHLGVDLASGELYPGADDNASGSATMMELARAAALTEGFVPKRTLLFASWNAEEEGLYGSCFYVENPIYPLEDTKAMFSLDMVGAGDGTGLILFGAQQASNRWIVDLLDGAAQAGGLTYEAIAAEALPQSDHACFAQAGVAAVLALTNGTHDLYHTPADTADTLAVADLEAAVRLMWAGLQPLARGEEEAFARALRPRATGAPPSRPRRPPAPGWPRH